MGLVEVMTMRKIWIYDNMDGMTCGDTDPCTNLSTIVPSLLAKTVYIALMAS